jgi:ABC-2 type transport system permease protein
MPAVVTPQVLLCGLFVPRDDLPVVLHEISEVLPLSFAVDAMGRVSRGSTEGIAGVDPAVWADLGVVFAFVVGCLVLGAATLRRRTA